MQYWPRKMPSSIRCCSSSKTRPGRAGARPCRRAIEIDEAAAATDVVDLGGVGQRMVGRLVDEAVPGEAEHQADRAHQHEHPRPAEGVRDRAHDRIEEDRGKILGGVEDRRGQAALRGREPRPRRGGCWPGTTAPRRRRARAAGRTAWRTRRGRRRAAGDDGLGHRERRPAEQAPPVDAPRALAVEQPAAGNLQRDVAPGERREQVAEGDRVEPQVARQVGADDRQRRPIGVVDRADQEQDQDDQVAGPGRGVRAPGAPAGRAAGDPGWGCTRCFCTIAPKLRVVCRERATRCSSAATAAAAAAVRRLPPARAGRQRRHRHPPPRRRHPRSRSPARSARLASCVLEGHRLAVRPIAPGEALLSWGLPFGHALVPIAPGDYVCNASILQALAMRQLGVPLPAAPNFEDYLVPFTLDPATYRPGQPVDRVARPRTFRGYRRPGGRGVGTRNTIVILGTTSRTASVARQLAVAAAAARQAHTRRSTASSPSPTPRAAARASRTTPPRCCARSPGSWSTRTSARSSRSISASSRSRTRGSQAYMREHGLPLDDVPHAFLSVGGGLAAGLAAGETIVRGWIDAVEADAPHRGAARPACGSRCSAAARTPSPACPATRSPAPSCTS